MRVDTSILGSVGTERNFEGGGTLPKPDEGFFLGLFEPGGVSSLLFSGEELRRVWVLRTLR